MQRWADAHPGYRWAPTPPGPPFVLDDRVAALHEAVTAGAEPAVLIAHSAGCITTVVWAGRHSGPVRGALLVTPPYFPYGVVPLDKLPFRTVLVASRTDPYTTFAQFEQYAERWGSELHDAGDAGHIETANGYGPWPDGERLVDALGCVPSPDARQPGS